VRMVRIMGGCAPGVPFRPGAAIELPMKDTLFALVCAVCAAIFAVFSPALSDARNVSPDKAFVAAYDAFRAGDRAGVERAREKLRGNALEYYLDFWRLRLRLEEAAPGEVREFLTRHAGTVLAEKLRRDWLIALGKNGQWELFRQELPVLQRSDREVQCYAIQERWHRQDGSVFADIGPFWRAPRTIPDGCAPVAEAMLQSGEITVQDLRYRFRVLTEADLVTEAKRVSARLPADQTPGTDQIDRVLKAPLRFLERADAEVKTAPGRELAIIALTRLSQSDPQAAANYWNGKLRDFFPRDDQQYVWAMLAPYGARRHLLQAVNWFKEAGETSLPDDKLAWRARIALRGENWKEVRSAIESMSPSLRNEPTWIYWLGRSLHALGMPEEGKALLSGIAGGHHFYGQLAAEELGMPISIPPKESPPTPKELAEVSELAGLRRALSLYRMGLRTEATLEWVWTVRALDDRALLAAAEVARRNELWDCAINTADRTVAMHDFTMRYLTPYSDVLGKQARTWKLDEPWVFGLVRQESRFIADAKSPAGATGLMQLLPSTARWVARKIGMKDFHASKVKLPKINAELGAFYLRYILGSFDGNLVLAAAGYNAGPGRARRWRDARPIEGAIYIETIPFEETRQYVKKVMVNTVYYDALFGGEKCSLKSRLGTIEGVPSAKDAP
jgi:soluble lytic murein transglycosylase